MKLSILWTRLVYVFDILTFSSRPAQAPLDGALTSHVSSPGDTPLIDVPKNPQSGKPFTCSYPKMKGFESCHGPNDRGCWLKSNDTNKKYNISSDYESLDDIPEGEKREFWLDVSEMPLSVDGVTMEHGKVFNRTYPGPWIEACWGDYIEVHVTNKLQFNGTSIHFHGIRQHKTPHMDGVNGITQCPIAPGDTFTYKFRAMQYGSSWYHSHYSLQYGDGLLGPMTIYGPSTANYDADEAFKPILMTDWNHRSVFEDWPVMLESGLAPRMTNILLNGHGQYGPAGESQDKYSITFDKGKKHLLILINTSLDTTFIFSIDGHKLEIIEADFVPIRPYNKTNLHIGIGQRYHVIVHAYPLKPAKHNNYWMRTIPARKCSKFACGPDEKMGILRYNATSTDDPLSEPFLFDIGCNDEPYESLIPFRNWTVRNPSNIDPSVIHPPSEKAYEFVVGMRNSSGFPYVPESPKNRWNMHDVPFRVNFSEPTILDLARESWPKYLDVVTVDGKEDQWIWLLITAPDEIPDGGEGIFFPAAHPMHLHGHDFALLKQSSEKWNSSKTKLTCDDPSIKCDNPPRRDVALLPASGYLIIAFKADNPGPWLIHCHIAFHASSGLAMQVIENKHLIPQTFKEDQDEVHRVCVNWDKWLSNPNNQWNFKNTHDFQDDSGV